MRQCWLVLLVLCWLSLLGLSLLASSLAQAQQRGALEYAVGLRGGYGRSNITFQPFQSHTQRPSREFGVAFRFSNVRVLGLAVELLYARTAYQTTEYLARREGHPVPLGHPLECENTWLRLPLLLHLRHTLGVLHIEALGGGYLDYLLGERVGPSVPELARQSIYLHTHNPLGVGMEAGGGIGFVFTWGTLLVEYRTWYRLTSLYERTRIPKQDEPRSNARNQTVGLAYYYVFH